MRKEDLIEYLEMKVVDGNIRDDEYGLYVECRHHGESFVDTESELYERLKEEYDMYYRGRI